MRRKSHVRSEPDQISPGQRRALHTIRTFLARKQFPPTLQELAELLDVSAATVHQHVTALVRKGYLAREPRKARGLKVLREANRSVDRLVGIPILGTVTAGLPMLAEENVVGEVLVDESIASRGRCFGLRIQGTSMKNADIHDGDVVVVRQQQVAESGDIVVALLNDEATVKRLHISGDHIELRPENRLFKPIVVGSDAELHILGKVIAIRGNVKK
jgi:repressor LexA